MPEELQQLQRASDLLPAHSSARDNQSVRATGLETLDTLLDGGLPKGRLIELIGRRSSGRFAAALSTLGAITRAGEPAALIDLGDSLEPDQATAAGIDLERLLWLRPRSTKQALISAEMLLGCGFPLLVLDLGMPPVRGGRGLEAGWLRLARAAQKRDSVLLVCSPYRVSGTAASAVIDARSGHGIWRRALLQGLGNRWQLAKRRGQRPGDKVALRLRLQEDLRIDDLGPEIDIRSRYKHDIDSPLRSPAPIPSTPTPSRPSRRPTVYEIEVPTDAWAPPRSRPSAPVRVAV